MGIISRGRFFPCRHWWMGWGTFASACLTYLLVRCWCWLRRAGSMHPIQRDDIGVRFQTYERAVHSITFFN